MKKRYLYIFIRATLIVLLSTTSIYCISNQKYPLAILIGIGISFMWTLNVKDIAVSNWKDRIAYVTGGVVGTATSLYGLSNIL